MIEGGPCACCGTTMASIWYGKKGTEKFCKRAECMRAGGYLPAKKIKGAAKRARAAATEVKEEEEETINVDLTVSEVIDIYGQRCATARHARPPARPVRTSLLTCGLNSSLSPATPRESGTATRSPWRSTSGGTRSRP